ncbi:myotubularin-related protein 10-B [Dermacentor albipictus]|uniref:myotubularin-related protein 10-B n=1 Tax=Dermacentor albipictus TaxID=60249 RepID=UPI0031FC4191
MQISTDSFPFKLGTRRNVLQVSDASPEQEAMGSESRLKRAGSSFVSYVDLGVGERSSARPPDTAPPPPDLIPQVTLKPVLCDGEVVVTEVDNVLKFNTFSDLRNGVSGVLFCTNFKLSFVTMDTSGESKPRALCANRVLGENDIGLLNVEALFQLSGGRRKRLSPQAAAAQSVEVLQVHCKDMRIFTFSFKFCQSDQCSAKVLQFLSRHAFVSSLDKLFCPRGGSIGKREPPFESAHEWDAELRRCAASKLWRVTELNERFRLSGALPGRFAVPRRLVDCKLERLAQHFCDKRVVAWCWSHASGAALVRGAASDTGSESADAERLQLLVQCLGAEVHLVNLDLECPIVREVGSSYHKLQALCMPADEAEFLEQEARFYAALESTRWLECVSGCLKVALAAAKVITERRKHVLVREQTGADMTCVVVSLVQIFLDPYYRTQVGFQTLVDKEWVAAGHPFPERLDHLGQGRASPEAAPLFLFFLDCVWQLQAQFPAAFEFSESYLTNLWDCTHVGIYDTFLFGNNRQRWEVLKVQPYRNVWDWVGPQSRLSPQDLELFKNPLYLLQRSKELLNVRSQEGAGDRGVPSFNEDLLCLDPTVKSLSVWTQCYYRWIPKAEVVNGDPATLFLHNVRVARDINFLAAQIRLLREHREGGEMVQLRHRRLPSDEYFFAIQRSSARPGVAIDSQHLVTSSFPFAPPGPVDWGSCHVPSVAPLPDNDYGDLDD